RELRNANLRDVRAGGDCGQPRLLHSEPALAGPNAVSPAAGESALITVGGPVVHPVKKQWAISRSQRLFDLGRRRPVPARKNERTLMKIFGGKTRKIRL